MMKKLMITLLLCALCQAAWASKHKVTGQLLYVQQADQAMLTPNSEGGSYTLTLASVKPIIYFTDQPKRQAGTVSVQDFLTTWEHNSQQKNFKPNAAVESYYVENGQQKEMDFFVTLSDPNYDASTGYITYQAKLIDQTHFDARSNLLLKRVSVFLDNFQPWPP